MIALAGYWTTQLAGVKRVMGRDGVDARWKLALANIDKLALAPSTLLSPP